MGFYFVVTTEDAAVRFGNDGYEGLSFLSMVENIDPQEYRLMYLAHRGGADISQLPKDMQAAIMATATEEEKRQDARVEKNVSDYRDQVRFLAEENGRLRKEVSDREVACSLTGARLYEANRSIKRLSDKITGLEKRKPASDLPSRDRMAYDVWLTHAYLSDSQHNEVFARVCFDLADVFIAETTRQREAKQ